MAWPTPQDYNEAVQSPLSSFADAELKMGQVEMNKLGLPKPISGRFAVVYNIRCGQRSFAVRCFQSEVPDQQERYAAISEHLKKANLPYTVQFEFLREGIRVGGRWYPVLKMEWVSGEPLHTFIEKHLRDTAALIRLASDWIAMTEALQKAALAHGDLQDGNVLVAADGLKLIDYDGMFVPALVGKRSNESGHRNYQHPNRTALDYGPYLDNFSDWVVYISLVALAIDPSLWTKLNGGDECLLFRKEDFDPNGKSQALAMLSNHHDPRLQNLGTLFASLLYLMPAQIPALATSTIVAPASLQQPAPLSPPSGADWLNDYVTSSASGNTQATPLTSAPVAMDTPLPMTSPTWILDFIAPIATPKAFENTVIMPRLILVATLILMILLPLLGSPAADLIGESILFTLLSTLPVLAYRRDPVVQERFSCLNREREEGIVLQELQSRLREQERIITRIRSEEKKDKGQVEQARETVRKNELLTQQRASAELKSKMDALTARQQQISRPLVKLQADYNAGLNHFNQQLVALNQQQVQELNTVIQSLQRQFLRDYLQSARIDTARITGIGQKMAANLRAAGYATAADVTWNVQNVSGIGSNKASALVGWRQMVESEARQKMPTSLSKSQENAIVAQYESQRKSIEVQAQAAKSNFEFQEKQLKQQIANVIGAIDAERIAAQQSFGQQAQTINAQFQTEHGSLSQQEAALTTEYSKKVAEVDRQCEEVRRSIYDQNWKVAKARQELEAYQTVTLAAYLLYLLSIRSARTTPRQVRP